MARVQLNVWVDETERDAIKRQALDRGMPVGRLIVEALLGASDSPAQVQEERLMALKRDVEEAVSGVAGMQSSFDDLERRLSRLEEMAGGQY
jgi:hypothetical protein